MTDQRNLPFETPPREQIPQISRWHIQGMESSGSDDVWTGAGMKHIIVHTIGRRSGNVHKVALPFWVDANGHRTVVGSYSGAPAHPDWYLNLASLDTPAEVICHVKPHRYWAEIDIVAGDDYTATWAALTADRPYYQDYQNQTERRLPLIRLREIRPADEPAGAVASADGVE